MLAQHERRLRHADILRPHDLVSPAILQHPVLMNAGLVREGVPADDGLVGLDALAGDFRQHLARCVQLFADNTGLDRQPIGSDARGHHDLFDRGVAGALANPVDRAFDLACARANRGERICDRQTEIVVAMRAEDRAVRVSARA
jgi:hypothetical protein